MATHRCRVHEAKQWSWLVPLLFDEERKGFSGGNSQFILGALALKLSHLASLSLGAFEYDDSNVHSLNPLSNYGEQHLIARSSIFV